MAAPAAPAPAEAAAPKGRPRRTPLVDRGDGPRPPWWQTPAFRILFALLLVSAAGTAVYFLTRETRLTIQVAGGDIQTRPEVAVVFNFYGKINLLRRDYQTRQQPLIRQVEEQELQLRGARSDLAGRRQRQKVLEDAMEQYQREIPQFLAQGQKALDTFWGKEGEALKDEYRNTLEAIHTEIEARARSLSIPYTRNQELNALEVAANAFRLALYNAPEGVKVDEQRKWVEEQLARWKRFETEWTERQLKLRDKAMAIKQEPGPKVEANQERINSLRQEIDAVAIEVRALENEVATYEERLAEAQQALDATIEPFLKELLATPEQFQKATFTLPESGTLEVRDLQQRTDLPPGTYTLMARGTRNGQEYWALKEFTLTAYKKNSVAVGPADFTAARTYLQPQ